MKKISFQFKHPDWVENPCIMWWKNTFLQCVWKKGVAPYLEEKLCFVFLFDWSRKTTFFCLHKIPPFWDTLYFDNCQQITKWLIDDWQTVVLIKFYQNTNKSTSKYLSNSSHQNKSYEICINKKSKTQIIVNKQSKMIWYLTIES